MCTVRQVDRLTWQEIQRLREAMLPRRPGNLVLFLSVVLFVTAAMHAQSSGTDVPGSGLRGAPPSGRPLSSN